MVSDKRLLKVFLCHAHADRDTVRGLYTRLVKDGVDAWLDKEKLIGGHDWEYEIRKAVRESDVVIVCLSKQFAQKGFRQYEVRIALEEANLQPEGEIFIIPMRLEECNVPQSLRRWHWVDLFEDDGYEKLMRALRTRADKIGVTLQLKRSWLPRITTPRSTQLKSTELKRPEETKKKTNEKKSEISDDNLLPPDNFPVGWEQEWRPSFEAETPKREQESASSAKLDLKPSEIEAKPEGAEKAAREKPKRDTTAKAKREGVERRTIQIAALKQTFSKSFSSFKSAIPKAKPFLRFVGIIGIIFILFWVSSLAMSQFLSPATTATASLTLQPEVTIIFTNSPKALTNTQQPNETPTITRTPQPTSLPTEITDTQGVQMVLVPEGKFIMGRDEDAFNFEDDEGPAHNVYLDAFYMDKYEVTNYFYKICVDAGTCTRPYNKSSNNRPLYYGNSEFNEYPVIYVDWYMAKAYCEWRGARLPTEAEWERAAQGTDTSQANYTGISLYNGDTTKVGSYPSGKSDYGAYDMAGNVWEWVNDWYQSDYYSTIGDNAENPEGPSEGDSKVLRGGSWFPGGYGKGIYNEGDISTFNRYRDFPLRYYFDTGFRCAKDANP